MGGSELGIGAHVVAVVRAKHCDVVAPHSGTGAAQLLLHAPPAPPPPTASRAQEFQAPSGEEGGYPTSIRLAGQPFQPDLHPLGARGPSVGWFGLLDLLAPLAFHLSPVRKLLGSRALSAGQKPSHLSRSGSGSS